MPHDKNGLEVKVGDRVLIEAVVESVTPSVDFCNMTVRMVIPMPPYEKGDVITMNTKSAAKIECCDTDDCDMNRREGR